MSKNYLLKILFMVCITSLILWSGTTGKIAGVVSDEKTGEPLMGVNVVIEELGSGAATGQDGSYLILNVPPGEYTLNFSMIGYRPVKVKSVQVNIDLTTNIDIEMGTEDIQGEAVEVIAQREVVKKDVTSTTSIVDSKKIDRMPITDMNEIVEMQAGMVDGHMRGGRSGEVQYRIDGMSVSDVYDGGQLITVSKDMIQEIQVVSGAFNAEYGQAMSGVVNVSTKSNFPEWGGQVTLYSGDYLTPHNDLFMGINQINPIATRNINVSLRGPIIKDKLSVSFNSRQVKWQGWLNGKDKYNPWNVAAPINGQDGPELYSLGQDPMIDSIIVQQNMPEGENFDSLYNHYRDIHSNPLGDGEYQPMQWNTNQYYHGLLGWKISSKMDFTLQGSYRDYTWQEYQSVSTDNRLYRYVPDGILTHNEKSNNIIAKFNHSLSMNTYYNLGFSRAEKKYKNYNENDIAIYPEVAANRVDSYSFLTGGSDNNRFRRKTITNTIKFDITSQVNKANKVKAGLEARLHTLTMQDYELRPPQEKTTIDLMFDDPVMDSPRIMDISSIYNSSYEHHPKQYAAYIQDKIELKELIINVGVRADYFEPDGIVLADPSDPSIYNPIKEEHKQDPIENRKEYWYEDASSNLQISPRFGASFPYTTKGIIHVSYGHFFQIPPFELLYRNPEFDLGSGTGNVGVIGNANLDAKKNVKGEIGLKQEIYPGFVVDLTAYFQDIRNLAGTRNTLIDLAGGAASYNKIDNTDFAYVKGLVLTLNYDNPAGYYGSIDYTYQIAKGTASNPEDARDAATSGSLPEIFLIPLDWDQRHTINLNAGYDSEIWGVNVIGRYGSGMPYTPIMTTDISTTLENSEFKPYTLNFDMNLYYLTNFMGLEQRWFVRVRNVFDKLNVTDVYPRSGEADFTPEEQRIKELNLAEVVNTVDEWFQNETYYEEPRRVEIGVKISF
ncbi:MAG: TonB-dependent receptor [Candidatus Marinimicrobia bacterium]|nr:TonB-dependent receptor [Candidatus Neomarinimicrobiota bacterium]